MKRRSFNQAMGMAFAGSLAPLEMLKRLVSGASYTMKHLRGNVGYFAERGGTILWMINTDGIVVVDSQFPEQAGHLIEELRKDSQSAISYLINTHHHRDHTSGNVAFRELAGHIVAHENSRINQQRSAEANGDIDGVLLPDQTFSKEWSAQVGDEPIMMKYHGRGHTDGDALTHFSHSNIVHVGDLVFNRRHPYIDTGAGASIENWIAVLDKVNADYDKSTMFVCGHAGEGYDIVIDRDDISAFTHYLERVLEYVGDGIRAGKSDAEILAATSIPGAAEWKGSGVERSLNAAILELRED